MDREQQQVTKLEAIVRGENAATATLAVEVYEGQEVAIHLKVEGEDAVSPTASLYLSPIDAAIHAERIIAAARAVVNGGSND